MTEQNVKHVHADYLTITFRANNLITPFMELPREACQTIS